MTEETKTKEGEQREALQLKRLLNPRKEELGDLTKWKHLDAGDMVLLNKLNAELTPQALDRINSMDEKQRKEGLSSIIVANYCSYVAKQHNKYDVANHIQTLIANQEMDAKEIGIYALEDMKNTLPSEKKMEAIAKGYLAKKKSLEEKLAPIDIVVLPITEDNAYVYVGKNAISSEDAPINIYYTGKRDDAMVNAILRKAGEYISSKRAKYWEGIVLMGGFAGAMVSTFAGGLTGLFSESVEAALITGFSVWGASFIAAHFLGEAETKCKSIKQKKKAAENSNIKNINWIESKDIEDIYTAMKTGNPISKAGYEHRIVQEAAESLIHNETLKKNMVENTKITYATKFNINVQGIPNLPKGTLYTKVPEKKKEEKGILNIGGSK
ncbi:MAG: hypothetical protein ABIB71_07900 [Candidatus Woesearchaeota archaeon]